MAADEPLPFEIDDAIVLLLGADPGPKEERGVVRGITRLEKLVFLLEKEADALEWLDSDPDFEAYNYGPFSKEVYRAADVLRLGGLITDSASPSMSEDDTWEETHVIGTAEPSEPFITRDFRLTERGQRYFDVLASEMNQDDLAKVSALRRKFAGWPLRALIRYVYRNHEDYTGNSLIRHEVLGRGSGDERRGSP